MNKSVILPASRAVLIYSSSKVDFKDVVMQAKERTRSSNVELEVLDGDRITSSDEERLLNDIRLIPPQTRGQVKSGGGKTLPISGSTKLNHSIPILVVYDGAKPIDVFPKDLMGVKYDLSSAFRTPTMPQVLGVEHNIVTILHSKPEIFGPGMKLTHTEFETGSGVIDMMLEDPEGVLLVVEVKEEADQETVGQVLKQSEGLKTKLGSAVTRKAIVALRTSGNVTAACRAAGVELYVVSVDRQA